MIVPALSSPRIALLVLSLPLARTRFGSRKQHARAPNHTSIFTIRSIQRPANALLGRIAFNNQLKPRVACPSKLPAHSSNPHS
jgi:hypothetical protein